MTGKRPAHGALIHVHDRTPVTLARLAQRTIVDLDVAQRLRETAEWTPSLEDLDAFAVFDREREKEFQLHLAAHREESYSCRCYYYASRWEDQGPKPQRGILIIGWLWRNDIRSAAIMANHSPDVTVEQLLIELHSSAAVCRTWACKRPPLPQACRDGWTTAAGLILGYAQREQRWWKRRRWPDVYVEPDFPAPPAWWSWD